MTQTTAEFDVIRDDSRRWLAPFAVAFALITLYALAFDQGLLLSPAFGDVSASQNYLHELFHDGRHLLGVPCH